MSSPHRTFIWGFVAGTLFGAAFGLGFHHFTRVQRVYYHHPDYLPITLLKTDRPFDLAILGRGYFCFQRDDGQTVYSRCSNLSLSETGELVSPNGARLDPPITIQPDFSKITVYDDGIVEVVVRDYSDSPTSCGQIQLAMFQNPDGLVYDPDGFLLETESSGSPILVMPEQQGAGLILQGYVLEKNEEHSDENSNLPKFEISVFDGVDDEIQEPLIETGRELDFAIEGPGFAIVMLRSGQIAYTRYLRLERDEWGYLRRSYPPTSMGNTLGLPIFHWTDQMPENWSPPPTPVAGESLLGAEVSSNPVEVPTPKLLYKTTCTEKPDEIQLVRFEAPEHLVYRLNGVYLESKLSGPAIPLDTTQALRTSLKQGYLNQVPHLEP